MVIKFCIPLVLIAVTFNGCSTNEDAKNKCPFLKKKDSITTPDPPLPTIVPVISDEDGEKKVISKLEQLIDKEKNFEVVKNETSVPCPHPLVNGMNETQCPFYKFRGSTR